MTRDLVLPSVMVSGPPRGIRRAWLAKWKAAGMKLSHRRLSLIRLNSGFVSLMRLRHGDEAATIFIWGGLDPAKPPPEVAKVLSEARRDDFPGIRKAMREVGCTPLETARYVLYARLVEKAHGFSVNQSFWTKFLYWTCTKPNFRRVHVIPFFRDFCVRHEEAVLRSQEHANDQIRQAIEAIPKRRKCPKCKGRGWRYSTRCKKCKGRGTLKIKKKGR